MSLLIWFPGTKKHVEKTTQATMIIGMISIEYTYIIIYIYIYSGFSFSDFQFIIFPVILYMQKNMVIPI